MKKNKEKSYMVISDDGCDYNVKKKNTDDGEVIELYYGNNGWTNKNALIGTILDDGNGVKIKFADKLHEKANIKKLDYSEAEYLRILLYFSHLNQTRPTKYKIFEEIKK